MRREPAWRRYLRFWGANPEADVDDEFRFHLETKITELRASGLSRKAAREEAIRQFGPIAPARSECIAISKQRERRASWLDSVRGWAADVRYALRVLRMAKASTAAAIVILGVGIGATTAVFTVMDRILYRPLPVPEPSRLALVSHGSPGADGKRKDETFSYSGYAHLRDHNTVFTGLAAKTVLVARERHTPERIERPAEAEIVSANYFDVLGVRPIAGRSLTAEDDGRAAPVAVASYRFSARRFDPPTDALGKTVYLNNRPFTIIGVMPPGFYGTQKGYDSDLYVPLSSVAVLFDGIDLNKGGWLRVIGRMRPGIDLAGAQRDIQNVWGQFAQNGMTRVSKDDRIGCVSGARGYEGTGSERQRSLQLLTAIVTLLLVIGCANVACLLIARGAARQHETAIRISLGAGRLRILRQSMLESGLLALAGGAGAVLVAQWTGRLLLMAFHWEKRPIDVTPDGRVLAFALAVSLLSAILFGLAPAIQLLRGGRLPLHHGETMASFSSGKVVVVLSVALSLVLVTGAAVFTRSLQNLRAIPTGFVPDHVSVIRLTHDTETDGPQPPVREAALLAESLRGIAGVQSAGLSNTLMFNDSLTQMLLRTTGNPKIHSVHYLLVDRGYFETLRIPLLAGSTIADRDDARSARIAVISENLAQTLFPNQNPLGKRVLIGRAVRQPKPGDEVEIVGIAKDTKFRQVTEPAPQTIYVPLLQGEHNSATVKLQVRSTMDPAMLAGIVRAKIRDAHLPLAVQSATALNDEIGASLTDDYIRMRASAIFGGVALALIASGLYGLIAYNVARRTREIGVRMAVGSSTAGIVALVVRQSLRLVAAGVVIGVPGAVIGMRAVSGMVFGLPPVDYFSLAIAAMLLALAALGASFVPAWRAAKLDPVQALRVQ